MFTHVCMGSSNTRFARSSFQAELNRLERVNAVALARLIREVNAEKANVVGGSKNDEEITKKFMVKMKKEGTIREELERERGQENNSGAEGWMPW